MTPGRLAEKERMGNGWHLQGAPPPKTLITPALFSRPLSTPLTGRRGRKARKDVKDSKDCRDEQQERSNRAPSPGDVVGRGAGVRVLGGGVR